MRAVKRAVWRVLQIVLVAGLCFSVGSVRADTAVTVLGVRALDGDDAFARKVSLALRAASHEVADFHVSERDVSLAQLSLAHGCEEPDAPCLTSIAETLSADRLIYGIEEQSSTEVRIALFSFDARAGKVDAKLERKLPAVEFGEGRMSATLATLVKQLVETRTSGSVLIAGDQPEARVALDGKAMGVLNPKGELLLEAVPAGDHAVVVEAADGARRELPVHVRAGNRITVRVVLVTEAVPAVVEQAVDEEPPAAVETPAAAKTPSDPRRRRKIIAWSAAGLGVGFLGAAIYSWVAIDHINKDPNMLAYRAQFAEANGGRGESNVCDEAENWGLTLRTGGAMGDLESKARVNCRRAQRLDTLQWVFVGGAVLSAGLSTYLFLTLPKEKGRDTVRIHPQFGRGIGYVAASVRF